MDRRREALWREIAAVAGTPGNGAWASAVCRVCVRLVPGIDSAALTLRATARAQDMLGASDDWAGTLDGLQYTLGEGPGVEAFTSGIPELVADLRAEEARWPGFCDAALAMDASAAFAFPRSCDCVAARSWPTGHCWRSPVTSSRRRSTPTN